MNASRICAAAETIAKRFSGPGQPYEGTISERGKWNGNITFHPDKLIEPLKWRKPRRVFVNSTSFSPISNGWNRRRNENAIGGADLLADMPLHKGSEGGEVEIYEH